VNGTQIPPIEIGQSMTYLGKEFSFSSDAENAQTKLTLSLHKILEFVQNLPITPVLKCHAVNLQIQSKLSFIMSHNSLGTTWLKNNLDTMVTGKIRSWLDLPPCATAHYIPLPHKRLGLDVILPSMLYEQNQATTQITLYNAADTNMTTILAQHPNLLNIDFSKPKKDIMKSIKQSNIQVLSEKFESLKLQSLVISAIICALPQKELVSWHKHISLLSPSIANFARKALIRCLATQSNMHRWGRSDTNLCPACKNLETENHVLNNCSVAAAQGRYTWRHNAVLWQIIVFLKAALTSNSIIYADLPGYENNTDVIFQASNIRPDITIVNGNRAFVLELTCCYETNFDQSREYKIQKYHSALNTLSSLNLNF
jgi:hypothetical protein